MCIVFTPFLLFAPIVSREKALLKAVWIWCVLLKIGTESGFRNNTLSCFCSLFLSISELIKNACERWKKVTCIGFRCNVIDFKILQHLMAIEWRRNSHLVYSIWVNLHTILSVSFTCFFIFNFVKKKLSNSSQCSIYINRFMYMQGRIQAGAWQACTPANICKAWVFRGRVIWTLNSG